MTLQQAAIAVTLDLEMCRNFPTRDQTHWDYEKGNLDEATKAYTLEAGRRVARAGGRLHCFTLGRTLEQEDVGWLAELHHAGHRIGNHTYDHLNLKGRSPADLQVRFARSPWLASGRSPIQIIEENIRMTEQAIESRLGIRSSGFRTPYAFEDGLSDRPDLQELLLGLGFDWVSSLYPAHPLDTPPMQPSRETLAGVLEAQQAAQPCRYASGLLEIPMSPISDIFAFRNGRWPLESFIEAVSACVDRAIQHRAVFDFLGHPACLSVVDPEFRTIDTICRLVQESRGAASLLTLDAIALSNVK